MRQSLTLYALETPAPHARHDQVRALGIRPAFRPHRGAAGVPRRRLRSGPNRRKAGLDRGRDGGRALRRHGVQPAGGCDYRRPQSAHQNASPARRHALARIQLGLRRRGLAPVLRGCGRPQSALSHAGAGGPRHRFLLFLHQAVHLVLAPGTGLLARYRAGRRVDRRARFARPAHPLAHRRRHLLDRRLRRHLLLPGFRIRSRRRVCSASRACSASPARCASRRSCTS